MPRMTATELDIQDVIDRWLREDFGGRVLVKHSPEYLSLVAAVNAFLKKRENVDAEKFRKAVDLAYQNGYNAGIGVKG
jgi:hypothetical protein